MSWHRRLLNLLRPERLSRDLDREIEFHLAERADELVAQGMSPEEALREARLRFGNPTVQKERTRDVDVPAWLDSLAADLRYAGRTLRASPAFALVAVLSLGLGIGANTAIFSLVNALMLRPLPVDRPEQLVQVTLGGTMGDFPNPLWEEIRDHNDVFAGAFAFTGYEFNLAGGGPARPVPGNWVSGEFFSTLAVRPALGRVLERADDVRGCPAVAVLSHGFWRSEYGGDPGVVGRTVSLEGHPFTVVGVAARGFSGVEVGTPAQIFAPLCAEAAVRGAGSFLDERAHWFLAIIGRPREGMTPEQVRAGLKAGAAPMFAATVPPDFPPDAQKQYLRNTLDARPAPNGLSTVRQQYSGALLALMGVVAVVLLISCANVANLLLARAASRQREIAVRMAIGAGRGRLVRQLLTESVLLSLLGAALGILFARWASELLVRMLGRMTGAVWLDLSIDGRVLGFTLAASIATGLLFGLAPAWRSTRVDPQAAMKGGGEAGHGGRPRLGVGRALVVGQVALSLVLVTAAGLLLGSFARLAALDPGFRREGVLLTTVRERGEPAPPEQAQARQREILERLRELPGVRAASASMITPISGAAWNGSVTVAESPTPETSDQEVYFNGVSDGYFATMGTTLIAGRDVSPADRDGAPLVAVINQTMARKFFGGASPLGKRFRAEPGSRVMEVVGVVADAKYRSLRETTTPTAFLPIAQAGPGPPWFALEVLAEGPPSALAPAVAAAVAEVSGSLSLEFTTLSAQVDASLRRERLMATLSGFFGGLALLLAMVGLYGTLSYGVARRKREMGIRLALGAQRARMLRMVMGEVGWMVGTGVVIGMAAALAGMRLVASFLFGVTPSDPATLVFSALLLAAVAIAAGAAPAWRASRLDPMVALREE
ncbi:MAG TPA: ABC transporter permease [Longimicrobium sp.]|nr:ABC transporter permease [Longimicrobium sp.]